MSKEFYAPPKSDIETAASAGPVLFTVSRPKLFVMMFLTYGLYMIYWNYKNWAGYKKYSGSTLWPVPRSIFSIFFFPSLFCKIDRALRERGQGGMPQWKALTVGVYAIFFCSILQGGVAKFIDQAAYSAGIAIPSTLFLFWSVLLVCLQCLIFTRVQFFINVLNDTPGGACNSRFTLLNGVWIVLGVGLMLFQLFMMHPTYFVFLLARFYQ